MVCLQEERCEMFFEKCKNGAVRLLVAVFFIILGTAGLFLPVIPGILFILMGLALLGNHHTRRLLSRIKEKMRRKKH
jgi:uncharacterized membrane protein YbaN (DUF454 family)